ncbi:acyl-CoA dehydratase activase [Chloroflexota bacterium]
MISAGIDVGAENTKAVIVKDGKVIASGSVETGLDQLASAKKAFEQVLKDSGVDEKSLGQIVATGMGREALSSFANKVVNDYVSAAKGISYFSPSVRVVIDAGAEEARAVKLNAQAKVVDFAVNEKCAAGAGTFVEAMSSALEVPLIEFAKLPLQSKEKISMNAQCVVFAESEVVSLIHSGVTRPDISKAVHDAIADRIAAMARRVGVEKDIALIGGMAKNVGFVDCLKRNLDTDILVPDNPEYVSAIGAAISD